MKKFEYFKHLNNPTNNKQMEELEAFAQVNQVPILQEDGLNFILNIIKLAKVKTILEIGTAIGYSALNFALINHEIMIQTIERDEKMFEEAKKNIAKFALEKQITLIYGDALETNISPDQTFDMIFIDAAKSQYQKFFEKYTPYLKQGGIVVTDNLIFHDLLFKDHIENRNTRQLVNKIKKYNEWLKGNQEYDTYFHSIGDGIAVSIKK